MIETRKPYGILMVSETATEQEIKKSHKQRAAENHPDRHPNDPDAERRMKDVNWAWGELSTPEKRKAADERLRAARYQANANAPPPPRAAPPPTYPPAPAPPSPQRSETPWGAILFGLGLVGVLFGSAAASTTGRTASAPRTRPRWDASVGRYRGPDGRFMSR